MDPNSEEYGYFIKNVLGNHLDQLLRKHRDAYLFPELLDGHVPEIDMVETDLQRLKEMFEAKHRHMIATMERRKDYQEQCSALRRELANEKQVTASLLKKTDDQKGRIAELERELAGTQATIVANVQKHERLETELRKTTEERISDADQLLRSMRELLSLEKQKFEALQQCHPPPQPTRRESTPGSMTEIMDQFQIVMQGCTTLISKQASHYFESMRSASDYSAPDVGVYEERFTRELNALGDTLGSFCRKMGCLPLSGEVDISVNFAL